MNLSRKICTLEGEGDRIRKDLKSSSPKIAERVQNDAQIVIFFRKAGDLATEGW